MNGFLSLWLAGVLLVPSCCGSAGSHEEDESEYDYETATPTADYDYNATFDYVFYINSTEVSSLMEVLARGSWNVPDATDTASRIGQVTLVLLLGLAVHQFFN